MPECRTAESSTDTPSAVRDTIAPSSSAVLYGRECEVFGVIDAVSEGDAAIALSRGGAIKPYSHVDPNEDSALFACGEEGILLAVADGHRGREAAEAAIFNLLEYHAARWTQAPPIADAAWPALAVEALVHLNAAILTHRDRGEKGLFRTTLALALLRPAQDAIHFLSIGDSHLFHVTEKGTTDLAWARSSDGERYYLGDCAETHESLAKKLVVGTQRMKGTLAIVAATDGISERGIGLDRPDIFVAQSVARAHAAASNESPERSGASVLALTREIAEATLTTHRQHKAGDNLALAVSLLA